MDQHIKGFEALGAECETVGGITSVKCKHLKGGRVYLDVISVGATINTMIAAVRAEGTTIIENAAKEPHVVDLANFLNTCGADIHGAGIDVITINGVKSLKGATYQIIPDQIEAGTYMAASVAARGDILITNVIPKHLESISAKLREVGGEIEYFEDSVRVSCSQKKLRRCNVKTMPYPGFPTDMQPQMVALLSICDGTSMVTEGVWESRFRYISELRRMGAKVSVDGRMAVIEGVHELVGTNVKSVDLRAGAAVVIAGLIAEGTTCIENINHIERGYEDIVGKLSNLGADIKTVTEAPQESGEYKEVC
jgi:UDP-N-acetylglucosamine 1-carboxyvinyltransferase